MQIEIGKRYKTKRGELVRRVLRVGRLTSTIYPVWVEMENGEVRNYTSEGAYYHSTAFPSGRDLVEVCEFDNFKIDDKVMVRLLGRTWVKRYFAGVSEKGKPTAFRNGNPLWTNADIPSVWDECRKPTDDELK